MALSTAAGSALAISVAAPATQDAAGYAALTFTEIGLIDKIGAIGGTFAEVEFQPLKGPKITLKGSRDNGTLNPSYAVDSNDAGQALMRTAANDPTSKFYSFMITRPDGEKVYFGGIVFGAPETIDTADTVTTANPTVKVCTNYVRVPAP
ncbi:hypothetical protein EYB45_08495 [Erythrobacteraceae bacterium CFH 75059]|uniref:hypothetical protein n=1 Tax=Qipengyuania thermophila TaxID=2509361 RepID=UPI001022804D|nr:hypothetical protein [Qipengyuania thermophila]TCD04277.1 hypothetical protein EYB45_08495 [Erythrobacteraceae bacterium CFH 75059]